MPRGSTPSKRTTTRHFSDKTGFATQRSQRMESLHGHADRLRPLGVGWVWIVKNPDDVGNTSFSNSSGAAGRWSDLRAVQRVLDLLGPTGVFPGPQGGVQRRVSTATSIGFCPPPDNAHRDQRCQVQREPHRHPKSVPVERIPLGGFIRGPGSRLPSTALGSSTEGTGSPASRSTGGWPTGSFGSTSDPGYEGCQTVCRFAWQN